MLEKPATGRQHAETAIALAHRAQLSADATGLATAALTPLAYLDTLEHHKLPDDACRLVAHWLRIREALWWGCLCSWYVYRPAPPELAAAALRAVVHMVQEPNEPHRRAAEKAAEKAGGDTPSGCLARAVSYSD